MNARPLVSVVHCGRKFERKWLGVSAFPLLNNVNQPFAAFFTGLRHRFLCGSAPFAVRRALLNANIPAVRERLKKQVRFR